MIQHGLIITVITVIIAITMATDGIIHTGDMTTGEIHIQTYRDAMTGNAIAPGSETAGRRLAIEYYGGLGIAWERVADHIPLPRLETPCGRGKHSRRAGAVNTIGQVLTQVDNSESSTRQMPYQPGKCRVRRRSAIAQERFKTSTI